MSSGDINPILHPEAYDVVTIGGKASPGVIKPGGITGFKRAHEWEVKKGKGTLGATLTYVQRPPAQGSITFTLVEQIHFELWEDFRPQFKYDPTKTNPQAVDIFHPVLADLDIGSVVCDSISQLENDGYGEWTCTVSLTEYAPPPKKPAVGTPTTSQTNTPSSTAGAQQPAVQDAQQAEIARLLEEASKPL
jgi:hypothetical protein